MPRTNLHNPGLPVTLHLEGMDITAYSISGLATYVMLPKYDLTFDLGHCPTEAVKLRNVFLSHVHQDHSLGVVRHASMRQMFGGRPSRVWCPAESADALRAVLRAFAVMEQRPTDGLDDVVRGVSVGDVIPLGRRVRVEAFDVVHRVPSRGYTVVELRQHLRPAYVGMPGAEIHAARLRGEVVADEHAHPVFTYIGDSTIATLERHPEVGRSDVLFLEATHLPGTDPKVSANYGHTHLDELVALFERAPEAFQSRRIVLKHFSMKYDADAVRAAWTALPDALRARVTMLV